MDSKSFSIFMVDHSPPDYLSTLVMPDESTKKYNPFAFSKIQSYNPLMSVVSDIPINSANVSFNNKYKLHDMSHVMNVETGEIEEKEVHVKFAPLLDTLRYLNGKYVSDDPSFFNNIGNLPTPNSTDIVHQKYNNIHNASYVDTFFYYLSSQLKSQHGFQHVVDYYDSFIGIQNKFKHNVYDDYEYLVKFPYFEETFGDIYEIMNETDSDYEEDDSNHDDPPDAAISDAVTANNNTLSNKPALHLESTNITGDKDLLLGVETLDDLFDDLPTGKDEECDMDTMDEEETLYTEIESDEADEELDDISHCSEDSNVIADDDALMEYPSTTLQGKKVIPNNLKDMLETYEVEPEFTECDDTNVDKDIFHIYLKNFPVQMICLEKCHKTLDSLFRNNHFTNELELMSLFFQVNIILATFKKTFNFIHNDLHTNNIMYVETNEPFLYYTYNNVNYRVPSFGKIYKFIDFGRSTYNYKGKVFCSDSYGPDGDAAGMFNTEPYFNENKRRLDPNHSFDIVRLVVSIYDYYFKASMSSTIKYVPQPNSIYRKCKTFESMILDIAKDDHGQNIVYKNNGITRYEGFKIYKMIVRTIHGKTPDEELQRKCYNIFKIDDVETWNIIEQNNSVMNIDKYPSWIKA